MRKKRKSSDYDKYSEDLIPGKIYIEKERGGFIFIFQEDGFIGVDTGENYYDRNVKIKMDEVIQEYISETLGFVLNVNIPNIVLGTNNVSTRELLFNRELMSSVLVFNQEYADAST